MPTCDLLHLQSEACEMLNCKRIQKLWQNMAKRSLIDVLQGRLCFGLGFRLDFGLGFGLGLGLRLELRFGLGLVLRLELRLGLRFMLWFGLRGLCRFGAS